MDNKAITALAREYAEFTNLSEVDKKYISAICENFLKYTLRRYCLVEKEAVRKEYIEARRDSKMAHRERLYTMLAVASARKALLESLFPEIAKEVEG
jgi:hypothetical protein